MSEGHDLDPSYLSEELIDHILSSELLSEVQTDTGFELAAVIDSILWSLLSLCTSLLPIVAIVILTKIVHHILEQKLLLKPDSPYFMLSTSVLGTILIELYLRLTIEEQELDVARKVIATTFLVSTFCLCWDEVYYFASRPNHLGAVIQVLLNLWPILINESLIRSGFSSLTSLRSVLMILAMKLWGIRCQDDHERRFFAILAYLVHPSSSIFGLSNTLVPSSRSREVKRTKSLKKQFSVFSKLFSKAFILLLISDGLIEIVVEFLDHITLQSPLYNISIIYLKSLRFRCSHYFSCYLAMSFISLWQEDHQTDLFCRIGSIEVPRSLVQVVTNWNIPMHRWLKIHVFNPVKNSTNQVTSAIACTYLVSSVLHGFKFHIWSVLLTLGLLTYLDQSYRHLLAEKFSACILARKCSYSSKGKCVRGHRNTEFNSLSVKLFNVFCTIATTVHLTYLGYIFTGNSDRETYLDALQSWSSLYFFTHQLAALGFLLLKVVNLQDLLKPR